jgi:hypothetical protein
MFSINADAYIRPVLGNVDVECEKTWIGQTLYNRRDLRSRRKNAMFGVAGAVAALCWRGEFIDDESIWYAPEMMSESDWESTGCIPGEPDDNCLEAISAVAAVLERGASHWDDLVSEARNLIISSQPLLRAYRVSTHLHMTERWVIEWLCSNPAEAAGEPLQRVLTNGM